MSADTPSEAAVWEALDHVYDPELEIDIVNLGLVYGVEVERSVVRITMTLTTMGCPAQELIEAQVCAAVLQLEWVETAELGWTFDPPWTPAMVTEEGRDMLLSMGFL